MSLWSRLRNALRGDRLSRELDEELQSHIDEAIEHGRDPSEAMRAFGSPLRIREESRDIKIAAWLDSLRADASFGWRQILKTRGASGVAILSLALAIGSCTSAFRLIDALLLRPLPVAEPGRLYYLAYEYKDRTGKIDTGDDFTYPNFRVLRAAAKDDAELMAISYANRIELTFGSDHEMEKAYRQYVSGWTMGAFGLKPAAGRLLTTSDDQKPGAHPYAVLSHDYWQRRFGGDPRVVGRTFRTGPDQYQIVGVLEKGFTGTEPGTITDIFIPTMMNARAVNAHGWSWFQTWVQLKPGADAEHARERLRAAFKAARQESTKGWSSTLSKAEIDEYVNAPLLLEPAAVGVSGMQKTYRRAMTILAVLVGLVLLIACTNVANLMTAQAASRAREMALRVSIGAGRGRLVQLVLVESALIAAIASMLGGVFAWWSAPFVVGMINPPDNPARLVLPGDWRVLGFACALALAVTVLFGLAPAFRASAVKPASVLKGGEDPRGRRRLMNALVAAQVAFCFLVHFVAGLFVSTFDRLSNLPTGFSSERVLVLEASSRSKQPVENWEQATDQLRSVGGVESAALARWGLMSGNSWGLRVWVNGRTFEGAGTSPYFHAVSPGWLDTMKIPLIDGRDFRAGDAHPRAAIVNEAFARDYFEGRNPIGKSFEIASKGDTRTSISIVGYVRDARYRNMRENPRPTAYVPFRSIGDEGKLDGRDGATFIVRTAGADPLALAPILRQEVSRVRPEFRVRNIRTQEEMVRAQTIRERMLATLSLFFAGVALLLAGAGLYGVLDYTVIQRRRELGIRLALGAKADDIIRRVGAEVFAMLLLGAAVGLALGIASEAYVETLLFDVKATDLTTLALPAVTMTVAALFAALPPVIRALRIDPSAMLRAE